MKPLIRHNTFLKSLSTYQDFLRKRPKHPLHFTFSVFRIPLESLQENNKHVQSKFLRALKIAKPFLVVSLGTFEADGSQLWETTFFSAFKKVSHAKALVVLRPYNNSGERYLKYFTRLQCLHYQLENYSFPIENNTLLPRQSVFDTQHPLKYLKYCRTLQELNVNDQSEEGYFTKTCLEPKRYLKSLENLTSFSISAKQWNQERVNFSLPLIFCRSLKCASFNFQDENSQELATQILNVLSILPHIQKIDLKIKKYITSDFIEAFQELASDGMLKTVKLKFDIDKPFNPEEILESLKKCKLKTFFLEIFIENDEHLKSIAEFLEAMNHLKSLKLRLTNRNLFSGNDNCIEICKQISKLQALSRLILSFQTENLVSHVTTKIPNFIPYLCELFLKPKKIKSFCLACNQIGSLEAFQTLMPILENSPTSLEYLKIDFDTFLWTKEIYQFIVRLMENSPRIREFDIPCLEINSDSGPFLKKIVQKVHAAKSLKTFGIGRINDTVDRSTFLQALDAILSKRGLRKLSCRGSYDLQNAIDLKKIIEKNPFLLCIDFAKSRILFNLFVETHKWV